MMEAVRTSETSVDNNFTRQYISEDNSEHREIFVHVLFLQMHKATVVVVDITVCCVDGKEKRPKSPLFRIKYSKSEAQMPSEIR
jgi:hypothetical protein